MKALVLFQTESTYPEDAQRVYNSLKRLGYDAEIMAVSSDGGSDLSNKIGVWDTETKQSANGYGLVCLSRPRNGTEAGDFLSLLLGDLCPFFVFNMIDDGSYLYANYGCDRVVTYTDTLGSSKVATYTDMGKLAIRSALYSAPSSSDTRGASRVVLATVDDDTSKFVSWKLTDGTYNCYYHADSANLDISAYLPILVQYAVNDGQIATPPAKLCLTWDLDDFPTSTGIGGGWNAADAQAFASHNKTKVTIGVPASKTIAETRGNTENQLADVWEGNGVNDVLRANQIRRGGNWYPIEHMGLTYWTGSSIEGRPFGDATTFDVANDEVDAGSAHAVDDNQIVAYTTTGSLPTPLAENTDYYVINAGLNSSTSYQLSLTKGGAAITLGGSPSGTHTAYQPKTGLDAFYKDHIDNMHTYGIYQGYEDSGLDSYGYHYFNTNRVDEAGIELMSPEVGKFADPLGVTAQAGYGIKVARLDSVYPDGNPKRKSYGSQFYRGVLLVESTGVIDSSDQEVDPNNQNFIVSSDGALSLCLRDYLSSGVFLEPMYLHGINGNAYADEVTYPNNILRYVVTYINNITDFCKDTAYGGYPTEYAEVAVSGAATGGTGEQSIISHNIIKH